MEPEPLQPQRPKKLSDKFDAEGHLLEPGWTGRRLLVRIGGEGPRFTGYEGPVEAPAEVYDALAGALRAASAVVDGVLIDDWEDERELEVDGQGNEVVRARPARLVYAAFDLLEVDGESLLDVPLMERKRHLEGVLVPGDQVRLTPYVTRNLKAWGDTLKEQGFRRAVIKDPNSPYSPGQTTGAWLVVERFGSK